MANFFDDLCKGEFRTNYSQGKIRERRENLQGRASTGKKGELKNREVGGEGWKQNLQGKARVVGNLGEGLGEGKRQGRQQWKTDGDGDAWRRSRTR